MKGASHRAVTIWYWNNLKRRIQWYKTVTAPLSAVFCTEASCFQINWRHDWPETRRQIAGKPIQELILMTRKSQRGWMDWLFVIVGDNRNKLMIHCSEYSRFCEPWYLETSQRDAAWCCEIKKESMPVIPSVCATGPQTICLVSPCEMLHVNWNWVEPNDPSRCWTTGQWYLLDASNRRLPGADSSRRKIARTCPNQYHARATAH